MATQTTPTRTPWEDRFREPTTDELLKGITPADIGDAVRDVHQRLGAFEGVTQRLEWQGIPWRWTVVFSCEMDPTRAWAYLVPEPSKPQLAVPLTAAMVQALPMRRLKKVIRDGIVYSKFVGGVYWPSWPIGGGASQLDELMEIIQRKYKYIRGEWGTPPVVIAKPKPSRPESGR